MTGTVHARGKYEYEKLPGTNISSLKVLRKSPKHYRHYLENGRKSTRSLELGTAAHIAILEPERFLKEFALWDKKDDEGKTKARRGAEWKAFESANESKTIIRSDEYDLAIDIKDAVRADRVAMKYLAFGKPEVALTWNDEHTGMACKGRLDWLTEADGGPCIVDLKGTRDPNPIWFSRDCARLDYHLQMAFYGDAIEAITGEVPRVVVVAVEMAPPHDVVTYIVPEEVLEVGRDAYRQLLEQLRDCTKINSWLGYGGGEERTLSLPLWAMPNEDQDISGLDLDWSQNNEQEAG
jgi:hypothetical protein